MNMNMKSFLMAGQSNMAGRGDFGVVEDISNERCFVLRNGLWERMSEPVNIDAPVFGQPWSGMLHSGIGLAPKFADLYANTYSEDVGLIPCAVGGTSAAQWLPGEFIYDYAVMQAKFAERISEVSGILWLQGEQDTGNESDAYAHEEKTRRIFEGFRNDLGENIPIIVGGIPINKNTLPFYETVNDGLRKICSEMPNCIYVSSDGLTCVEDGVHFAPESYREYGKRFFEAFCLIKKNR